MEIEFLIRRTDGEWFSAAKVMTAEVLKPRSVPSEPTPGWGDHRIKIPNGVIAFAYEDPGIQITFEEFTGSREEAMRIVGEILANIESVAGELGRIVPL
jgi:hypothetical protein